MNSAKSIRDPSGQIQEQKNLPNTMVRRMVIMEIRRPDIIMPEAAIVIIAARGSRKKNRSKGRGYFSCPASRIPVQNRKKKKI